VGGWWVVIHLFNQSINQSGNKLDQEEGRKNA
jgi:hypothetical protein